MTLQVTKVNKILLDTSYLLCIQVPIILFCALLCCVLFWKGKQTSLQHQHVTAITNWFNYLIERYPVWGPDATYESRGDGACSLYLTQVWVAWAVSHSVPSCQADSPSLSTHSSVENVFFPNLLWHFLNLKHYSVDIALLPFLLFVLFSATIIYVPALGCGVG